MRAAPMPFALFLLLSSACHTPHVLRPDSLHELASWMSGTFSSKAQSDADPENYFDIRQVIMPVWTDRSDGPWLYVEQAVATKLDKPYRQRVYHLVALGHDTIRSDVYTLPGDPLVHAATWRGEAPLADIAPETLTSRDGCSITLHRSSPNEFTGLTVGDGCASDLRGATYATSEAVISEHGLTSWDRGFDKDKKQVWGATKGPYRFDKLSSEAPK